ncbi:MAG TPA: 50S ribosomal protein L5 [Candidatus Acidoferrales bacterium]|nr:50S ribosomal protein L5 [Candidatus Acidoferrales bacterium]
MDLQKKFTEELVQKLEKDLGIKNPMAVPHLEKIVVNMGVKDAVSDKKIIEKMSAALGQVTGQKAKPTKARKAIAGFKIRQGDTIGLAVTIRGKRMYAFYDRLVKIVLPRLKDFRGVPRGSFDGRGNYTLGFHEYSTFPEIDPASVERLQGMEMVFVTTAKDNAQGFALLEAMGMPFAKEAKK